MASRYSNREINSNYNEKYATILRKRNIYFIDQYVSPNQTYPTSDEIASVASVPHLWKLGDRFYKLAAEFYGDPTLWWVIAWYNQMPTEHHVEIGWVVDIPMPLEEALTLWNK